jgi:hypothetical protein
VAHGASPAKQSSFRGFAKRRTRLRGRSRFGAAKARNPGATATASAPGFRIALRASGMTKVENIAHTLQRVRETNASRPVSRVLYPLRGDDHSSGPCVAARFSRPTRMQPADGPEKLAPLAHPYSVLLPAGLAVPASLRSRRWAVSAWSPDFPRMLAHPRPSGRLARPM